MKNPIYIIISLAVFCLVSCGQNSYEKKLIGKWYGLENDGFTRLYFYPDSLIFIEGNVQNVKWTANESKIQFDLVNRLPYENSKNDTIRMNLDYVLSDGQNGLEIKDSTGDKNFSLIRADNYFAYLSKKNNIPFMLPNENNIQPIPLYDKYGLKLFIGNSKTGVISEFGNDLGSINADIKNFKQNLQPLNEHHQRKLDSEFHLRIFADKSITDKQIEKEIEVLTASEIIHVYRIYKSDNYYNFENLKGKRIKTIANNGYDSLLVGQHKEKSLPSMN